jgi:pimeloyl-ACP methyl ester carboxylesterase
MTSKQSKTTKNAADYIHPLNMNGLRGRVLRMPSAGKKNREILVVYGHHSSIERWWGAIQVLNRYGTVTVPDLPGFGGMDSFYKIDEKPTIDNFADYLAAFVKMFYKRRRVTIVGLSFGFVVATRMLQRYPDLVGKVDILISAAGFAHYEDFTFSKSRLAFYRSGSALFSRQIPSVLFKAICLNPMVIRLVYGRTYNARKKFAPGDAANHKAIMDFEVYLWHCNELRTYMSTGNQFLHLNNCQTQIKLPVWHVCVAGDQYFDNDMVEQHMKVIFSDFNAVKSRLDNHAISIIATAKDAEKIFPPAIRQLLKS